MKKTKYIHVDGYVAEVDVDLIESEPNDDWGPYLSIEDALLLDEVKELLRQNNVGEAAKKARVFTLTPVATNS